MKNLATIAASAALAMGIITAKPALAGHFEGHRTCTELAEVFSNYVDSLTQVRRQDYQPHFFRMYGRRGEISPDSYDKCLISDVENPTKGEFSIEVIKIDPIGYFGTTYTLIRNLN